MDSALTLSCFTWFKLGLELAATFAFYVSLTPPSPPPERSEIVKTPSSTLDWFRIAFLTPATKYAAMLPSLIEIAVVLLSRYPPEYSTQLTSLLRYDANTFISRPPAAFLLGVSVTLLGTATRIWCFLVMGQNFMFQLALRKDHQLVTHGPYSIVRHPSYTGWYLSILGICIMNLSEGSWLRASGFLQTWSGALIALAWAATNVMFSLKIQKRVHVEDGFLFDRFSIEWEEYAERVPFRLVPGIF
ncbi:hypothetical protein CONPUDRAFT_166405 [Coniophora puteana RWD-64-598 SS2]|uniref:Protein-S-isoprenylcysteine O-methyltransferase n=1 Tax=Coniophora puteana (strain RWD-64-598) TaxID=741705 RepID=A0A5M3MKT1_CONPW|nr:uncharacterized protein CONPUDRAFT_166405 [Coniophora puteana RWD-64-598 SS2]EIW79676.1 hypothetical protein CONPUDRAFT_166405 [Coniophora puteana RWD-64-598 SS2]